MPRVETDCRASAVLLEEWPIPPFDAEMNGHASPVRTEPFSLRGAATETLICEGRNTSSLASVGGESVSPCPGWKRAMDLCGALVGLMLLSPLFFAVAFYIKLASRGPVFFRQQRYGALGRPFMMWKFRTIEMDNASQRHMAYVSGLMDSHKRLEKCDRELKIIQGGRVLRKLGIDELPQLFNVLKGDMSLVGPRPDVMPPDSYQPWQRRRFNVVPGITGLWQVSGKNNTTFATMMRMDILYVRRRSPWLDVSILLQTFPTVLFG